MNIFRIIRDLALEIIYLTRRVKKLECHMSELSEKLDALGTKVDAVQADVDVLKTKSDQLDAEGQAALDRLSGKLDGLAADVGDQDGSDSPAPAPADGGTGDQGETPSA